MTISNAKALIQMQSNGRILLFDALEKLILRLRTSSEHRTTVNYVMDIIDYQTHKVRFEPQRELLVINITKSQGQVHLIYPRSILNHEVGNWLDRDEVGKMIGTRSWPIIFDPSDDIRLNLWFDQFMDH